MHVIATAGHVDHGKSTLVRALTGMEPDRWAEERRRGMTIDLGYAWTTLPSGETLAFVDVPGHQRFIGNMLAGLGPAPAVLLIVAADEGWREQSTEHFAAVAALGIGHGLVVVTKTDLADPKPAVDAARRRLSDTELADAEVVAVSVVTGNGIPELQAALSRLVRTLPPPDVHDRVRLWVDRAFTIRGSGTVVTGTLGVGTVLVDDQLDLRGRGVRIRGLQSLGEARAQVSAVSRVAINLRSVDRNGVRRGDALLTPDAWRLTSTVDVRLLPVPARLTGIDKPTGVGSVRQYGANRVVDNGFADLPAEQMFFLGTAAVPVHVRALDFEFARLTLDAALPLQVGDHAILSDRTRRHLPRGVLVIDPDPVPFRRRGAAAARARELIAAGPTPTLRDHLSWRGAARPADLRAWGVDVTDRAGVRDVGGWLIDADCWAEWTTRLAAAVDLQARREPQNPTLPVDQARSEIGAPDRALIGPLAVAAGLQVGRGEVGRPDRVRSLGSAENAVREVEALLRADPFAAPDRGDLDRLGLAPKDLAIAAAAGRLLRVDHEIVLLPDAPARAMRILSTLPEPFTTSQARETLASTRRVVIPLLEYLDRQGLTQRLDGGHRKVRR